MHLKAITLFGCKFKCVILFKIGNFAIRRSFLPTLILVIIFIFLIVGVMVMGWEKEYWGEKRPFFGGLL